MAFNAKDIIELIEAENPKLTVETKELLESAMIFPTNYDYTFYRIVRLHHADRIEMQYRVLEKILDKIKSTDDQQTYMKALKQAFKQVRDYCLGYNENKLAPLMLTLMRQIKNIDPSARSEFFREMKQIFVTCYIVANALELDLAASRMHTTEHGGEVLQYDKTTKWPLHVIVESARQALPALTSSLVSEFRNQCDINTMTIQEMLEAEILPFIGSNQIYLLEKRLLLPEHIIKHLIEEWELQYERQKKSLLEFFEPMTIMGDQTRDGITEITADYLGMPQGRYLFPQFLAEHAAAKARALEEVTMTASAAVSAAEATAISLATAQSLSTIRVSIAADPKLAVPATLPSGDVPLTAVIHPAAITPIIPTAPALDPADTSTTALSATVHPAVMPGVRPFLLQTKRKFTI